MIRILGAHLATRCLIVDINIDPADSVADLKALVLKKLAEDGPTSPEHRVERWLFESEGSEPTLAEIVEADDYKAVGSLGLQNYSILYLDSPALLDRKLRPLKLFCNALQSSKASAATITAIVVRLNCGLEAAVTEEDGLGGGQNFEGATPLILATRAERTDVALSLVTAGANVNALSSKKHTSLQMAAQTGDVALVRLLVSADAELECRDAEGWSPMLGAALVGHVDVVETLLASGANVDATDNYGQTPLHWASYWGHITVVEALLTAGASMDLSDKYCTTPLHMASKAGLHDVMEALLAAGANVDAADKEGRTPLHIASTSNQVVAAKVLLAAGANSNNTIPEGGEFSHIQF